MSLEDDKVLFENSIQYLHNIATLPFLDVPALKSIYLTRSRLMELRKQLFLPSDKTRSSIRCQRCFLTLLDGPAHYKIKPERKQTRFAKKLMAKVQCKKLLTAYQRTYSEQLSNFRGNQLAITCKFCKNESFIKLEKPQKIVKQNILNISSKRKKKRKDKFCGLDQDIVLSLTPQNFRNLDNSDENSLVPTGIKTPKFRINRRENLDTNMSNITKENRIVKENGNKIKKKNKFLSKLSDLLNNPIKPSKSPVQSLDIFFREG